MSQTNAAVRTAIIETLPPDTSLHGQEPNQSGVYVPPSHIKALRLECNLVVGARGVGKTFWSAALHSSEIREMLGTSVPDLSRVNVSTGFGERSNLDAYPDADTFGSLLKEGIEPYDIWRAVLTRWAGRTLGTNVLGSSWKESVTWVIQEPEQFGRLLEQLDQKLSGENRFELIVFDALDRSGTVWQTMDRIVRDLLRVALLLKRFPRLHSKIFLREDQYDGRPITNFPDASKLLATRVELLWSPNDLHGLLWQLLCNGPNEHGEALRNIYREVVDTLPQELGNQVWKIHEHLKRDEPLQRKLFAAIAGDQMGRDKRRGVPYTWSVGHLADGKGRTSPRSFLAAIRAAAEDSLERYSAHEHPLHFESIKRGVQKASEIRISEMAEDYPWVTTFMEPLKGQTVPCAFSSIQKEWEQKLGAAPSGISFTGLPPEHQDEGWDGIRKDLESLGIFETMRDGRINMPDLYRVGFGLGRRGGVRPQRTQE